MNKTIEMSKELFTKWVAALRSGEIKQAKGTLINETTGAMCCLGVLQYVATGGQVESGGLPTCDFLQRHNIKFFNSSGIADQGPDLVDNGFASELNDKGVSFNEIADLLEQNVKFTDE